MSSILGMMSNRGGIAVCYAQCLALKVGSSLPRSRRNILPKRAGSRPLTRTLLVREREAAPRASLENEGQRDRKSVSPHLALAALVSASSWCPSAHAMTMKVDGIYGITSYLLGALFLLSSAAVVDRLTRGDVPKDSPTSSQPTADAPAPPPPPPAALATSEPASSTPAPPPAAKAASGTPGAATPPMSTPPRPKVVISDAAAAAMVKATLAAESSAQVAGEAAEKAISALDKMADLAMTAAESREMKGRLELVERQLASALAIIDKLAVQLEEAHAAIEASKIDTERAEIWPIRTDVVASPASSKGGSPSPSASAHRSDAELEKEAIWSLLVSHP